MSNYSLQRYKGTATRHTCPNCGDRHSFAYYVDEQNIPLHPTVGRCNHESGCGYHYTPKQYFRNIPNVVPPTVSLLTGKEWNKSPSRYHSQVP